MSATLTPANADGGLERLRHHDARHPPARS